MKINKFLIPFLIGLNIIIGIIAWYLYPFGKFGMIVLYDHFQANSHKPQVEEYVEKMYGEKAKIQNISYDGESGIDMLVASVYEKDNHENYSVYYDLHQEKILFDELRLKKQGDKYFNSKLDKSTEGKKLNKKDLEEAIKQQEKMIRIFESEVKEAMTNYDNQKLDILAFHLEKEYEKLGMLKNDYDSILEENRG